MKWSRVNPFQMMMKTNPIPIDTTSWNEIQVQGKSDLEHR